MSAGIERERERLVGDSSNGASLAIVDSSNGASLAIVDSSNGASLAIVPADSSSSHAATGLSVLDDLMLQMRQAIQDFGGYLSEEAGAGATSTAPQPDWIGALFVAMQEAMTQVTIHVTVYSCITCESECCLCG